MIRIRSSAHRAHARPVMLTGGIATLYSLAASMDLRAFAVQVLLLALFVWGLYGWNDTTGSGDDFLSRVSLGAGTLLMAAILLIGPTTGGEYNLSALSLSALTIWPLAMISGVRALLASACHRSRGGAL